MTMKLKLTMLTATLVTALGISACSSPSQPSASLPPNKDTLLIANDAEPVTLDPKKAKIPPALPSFGRCLKAW